MERCILAVATAVLAAPAADVPPRLPRLRQTATVTLDDHTWYHFNTASFDQEKILSAGHFQYTLYWDADKALVLVRRNLDDNSFQTLRLPAHTLTINPRDGHRNTVLGMSRADGRLHLSWDHHCNPLRYTRSRAGFLTSPPANMSLADFEPAQPLMAEDKLESTVTYPRFVHDHDGSLFFVYRQGSSGRGDTYTHRYDAANGTWTRMGTTGLFSRRGIFPAWNNSPSRNAYTNDILFDRRGRLHVSWTFREAGKSWASNHDLHYAYSDDHGVTWHDNAGTQVADLPAGDPIELADPGLVVWEIPVYSWLMNQTTMVLDSHNRPHVITYKLPKPEKPKKLEHGPPPEIGAKLAMFHYWRDDDGGWHQNGPLLPLRRRPGVVADSHDNLVVYHADDGGLAVHTASAADQWSSWRTERLEVPGAKIVKIGKPDRGLAVAAQRLSFVAITQTAVDRRGVTLLDFAIEQRPQ